MKKSWAAATALLGCAMMAFGAKADGVQTATLRVVEPNRSWGGVLLQMSACTSSTACPAFETGCPINGWAFVPSSDSAYNATVATLLAAFLQGATVTVYTDGCVTSANGFSAPHVFAVDFGVRAPGT
jgi:hypothetical protein